MQNVIHLETLDSSTKLYFCAIITYCLRIRQILNWNNSATSSTLILPVPSVEKQEDTKAVDSYTKFVTFLTTIGLVVSSV